MGFRDTHAAVFAEGYEGDASADLLASYDEDSGLASAAIAEAGLAAEALTGQINAGLAEIQRLKAVNFTLLEQISGAPDDVIEPPADEDNDDADDSDDDNPASVADALEANKIEEE